MGTVNLVVCLVAGRIPGLFAVRWGGAGLVGVEAPSYKGFRFPAEIISHGVWLYHRFPLSFCEVEERMLQRGIIVSHETLRQWCAKFGQTYVNALWRAPGPSGGSVAPRGGVHHDQRSAAVLVAGGGPARDRAGHSGHFPARHQGGDEVLS
jgi:hypothetical protein